MNLAETLYMMMQENSQAGQPTDLRVGTVTSADPLEISINAQMAPLKRGVLYLTESVIEKKIPVLTHKHYIQTLGHSHTAPEGQTTTDLMGQYLGESSLASSGADTTLQGQNIICYENGKALPIEGGFIILNRALDVGDKVLLLRVQNGQKFVVLSRVFEEG